MFADSSDPSSRFLQANGFSKVFVSCRQFSPTFQSFLFIVAPTGLEPARLAALVPNLQGYLTLDQRVCHSTTGPHQIIIV